MLVLEARDGRTIYRLCRKDSCCPEVSLDIERKEIIITDDYNGIVKIPVDNLEDLVTSLSMISKQTRE